jgi:hypothetical protein
VTDPRPVPLDPATEERLARLFSGEALEEARGMLERDCGEGVPGWELVGLERMRAAVLKLGDGSLEALAGAIELAWTDVRDAVVAAGFGERADAHEAWWPDRGPEA